jgi:hypothetical protein
LTLFNFVFLKLPKPPQMMTKLHDQKSKVASNVNSNDDDDFEIVNNEDLGTDREEIFQRLEQDLRSQIKIANTNTLYFTNLGDVTNATK